MRGLLVVLGVLVACHDEGPPPTERPTAPRCGLSDEDGDGLDPV